MTSRRLFLKLVPMAGLAATLSPRLLAAPEALHETDPLAMNLGYKADTATVDGKKYPNHQPGQSCAGCQLYQGKSGDKDGPCSIFAGKLVSGKGWCSAWVKKA